MSSTKPVSLDFDSLATGAMPLPASFDTLRFSGASVPDPAMPEDTISRIYAYDNDETNHYLQLSSAPLAVSDTFTMTARDGSAFNLQSMAVTTNASFTVTGYNVYGVQVASDTVQLGVPDLGGSIQFTQLSSDTTFDTLTFDRTWTDVATVTFSSMPTRPSARSPSTISCSIPCASTWQAAATAAPKATTSLTSRRRC